MGPFRVVALHPLLTDLANFPERGEDPGVQDLGAVGAVEAFDEGVLIRLTRRDVMQLIPLDVAPGYQRLGDELGAIVRAERGRGTYRTTSCSSTWTTRTLGSE